MAQDFVKTCWKSQNRISDDITFVISEQLLAKVKGKSIPSRFFTAVLFL